jgi:hypothetical protein
MNKPGDVYARNGRQPVATLASSSAAERLLTVGYSDKILVSLGFCNNSGKCALDVCLAVFDETEQIAANAYAQAIRAVLAESIDHVIADHYRRQAVKPNNRDEE